MILRSLARSLALGLAAATFVPALAHAAPAAPVPVSTTATGAPQTGSHGGKPAIIPISEVRAGMKGYGLTVFKGTKPERFDVRVIGVLHNFLPKQDIILIQ